jgi:hypothetical protein
MATGVPLFTIYCGREEASIYAYEAIKERGSIVIVPSSAVETMGLGGSLAPAALGGAKREYFRQ